MSLTCHVLPRPPMFDMYCDMVFTPVAWLVFSWVYPCPQLAELWSILLGFLSLPWFCNGLRFHKYTRHGLTKGTPMSDMGWRLSWVFMVFSWVNPRMTWVFAKRQKNDVISSTSQGCKPRLSQDHPWRHGRNSDNFFVRVFLR